MHFSYVLVAAATLFTSTLASPLHPDAAQAKPPYRMENQTTVDLARRGPTGYGTGALPNNAAPTTQQLGPGALPNNAAPTTRQLGPLRAGAADAAVPPQPTDPPTAATCTLQDEDPDLGINTPFCSCSDSSTSATLPVLPVSGTEGPAASCSYTTIPQTGALSIATQTVTTNTAMCQVCTQDMGSPWSCSIIPNCVPATPTSMASPTTTVEVGLNPVHLGQFYGTKGMQAIGDLIKGACGDADTGTPMSCNSSPMSIDGVDVVNDNYLQSGTLGVTIQSSNYTDNITRDNMIMAWVASFNQSASGANCQTQQFTWCNSDAPGGGSKKRDLSYHNITERDVPFEDDCSQQGVELMCAASSSMNVQIVGDSSPGQPSILAYLNIDLDFENTSLEFDCHVAADAIGALLALPPDIGPILGMTVNPLITGKIDACCTGDCSAPAKLKKRKSGRFI